MPATVRRRAIRRLILRSLGALLGVVVAGLALLPTGRYLVRAAWEEGRILARRQPIERLAADTVTPAATRERLRLVLRVRQYAAEVLGLRSGRSFTTYSRVDGDTLVLVLSAARRDTLAAYTWWFPVVGRVPYKGYFDPRAALAAAEGLRRRGFDTYLRPASAFSTLGWFNDPLLSTTLRADSVTLANTVVHELAHNALFLRGQVPFNESFASLIGARGAADYFRSQGDERSARLAEQDWGDDKTMGAFWLALSRAIDSVYAAHPGDSASRVAARDTVAARMRTVLLNDLAPRMPTRPRAWLERLPLDNASLLAHQAYAADLYLFDEVFRRSGGDVRRTVARIRALTAGADDPFAAMRQWAQTTDGVRE